MVNKNEKKVKTEKVNTYCVDCFKALGVPSRIEIFDFIRKRKRASVNEVVAFIGLTQPTVSYHLKEMYERELLARSKEGKSVYYSISFECPNKNSDCVLKSMNFRTERQE